jgi:drug/metabolite transporter (DMT)-like permease
MAAPHHLVWLVLLGSFWGLSPTLYKAMGEAGLPITHVIVFTGLGVGIALAIVPLARTGRIGFTREVLWFGFGCGAILNIPFALGLLFSRHIAATEYALIASTAPFWNYLLALLTGRDRSEGRRLLAIAVGFVSSAVLILSRGGFSGEISLWVMGCFSVPVIYSLYNWFAARFWPPGADVLAIGAAESVFSALCAVPFMLYFAPPWGAGALQAAAYGSALIATVMWVIERIAFFTLIRDRGPVYTIQAIYVSTPAAVIWAILFYGGGADPWLWASLAILMVALWLNNTARSRR